MANVEARIKVKGKEYEILVDVDKAIGFKKGIGSIDNVLAVNEIFYDLKKGLKASTSDLQTAFGTSDIREVAKKIILQGEVVLPSDYRKKEIDIKKKQVIDFLRRNAIDAVSGQAHSEKRIETALEEAKVRIDNKPIEQQISEIISQLRNVLPIKIETKKLKIIIPALHTGKAYGMLKEYKEKEDWLGNGDLSCLINIPAGLQMDFYDKLNAITHGSAIVEEVKK